ncbi:MAG: dephospho-CoA kinase [Clostridia bacterium]|nr:dephospho-CoA kinase [Clostridia bacterium]
MLISITGKLGSGKSTVCNLLKDRYGFEIYSTGAFQREVARSMGITTLELNKRLREDPSLDYVIDDKVKQLSIEKAEEKLIFDSRMAWHFAVKSFKIFLTIEPCEAARRVMLNQRGCEEHYADEKEACEELIERSQVEQARFMQIYGVDYYDYGNFDLIVDTTARTPDEIVDIIVAAYESYVADEASYIRRVFD